MHVWYAAYGSNLSRERFDTYLRGGRPLGTTHDYPGCRDVTPPASDIACEIEAELAFGGTSQTWGGGVAFLRPAASRTDVVKARLYLVTLEQVADVVAQENWLDPGAVTLDEPASDEMTVLEGQMYGTVFPLRPRDGVPVLALTQTGEPALAAPSPAYLRHIADGLRGAHAMSDAEIVAYLASKRGIRGLLSMDELARAVS
jgi:hypothetical protein